MYLQLNLALQLFVSFIREIKERDINVLERQLLQIHGRATSLKVNSQMGMKLLASLAATETSKDRQVPVVGATERCSFATGEGSVDESTIKCSVDKIDSSPSKDAYDRSAICMKEVKDLNVARDSPDVSSNGLLNTIQTLEMPIEQIRCIIEDEKVLLLNSLDNYDSAVCGRTTDTLEC